MVTILWREYFDVSFWAENTMLDFICCKLFFINEFAVLLLCFQVPVIHSFFVKVFVIVQIVM